MKITILGGAGFIGTNLILKLARNNDVTVVESDEKYFKTLKSLGVSVNYKVSAFDLETDFDEIVKDCNILYHLISTNIPGNSNKHVSDDIEANVIVTSKLLDACVRQNINRVIFISSGGAVYGEKAHCPLNEEMVTYPISSYGLQKVTIEKLLYLYQYQYGLDYRVIRLANPYGPYQRPNGKLGVITTFIYQAITSGELSVFGNGSVIRDFIYIDDAIRGIINISKDRSRFRTFNLGSGKGTSLNEVIEIIKTTINENLEIHYLHDRKVDVPVNYLDISRYNEIFGDLNPISLRVGIQKTANFLRKGMKND